jgi:uncharacterized coiled-coil protein SlyX
MLDQKHEAIDTLSRRIDELQYSLAEQRMIAIGANEKLRLCTQEVKQLRNTALTYENVKKQINNLKTVADCEKLKSVMEKAQRKRVKRKLELFCVFHLIFYNYLISTVTRKVSKRC